jgi:hypothetical protein
MVVSSRKVGGSHDVCCQWNSSSISLFNCPRCTGIGAHDGPESLPTMRRNWCPRCAGIRKSKPLKQLPQLFLNSDVVTTKNALVLDLMGTTAAGSGLVSLLLYQLIGERRFDGVGAMVIGLTTAILAFVLIIGIKGLLVGERAAPQIEEKIKKAALSIPQVREILDLRTMQIGPDKLLVNIDVHMQDQLTTDDLETLIDKIEKRIREKVSSVRYVQVELETPE